ncbi:cytochrome P450 6j1-like [Lutzomyia longipalpis]|uniref:Cytochrome n=1 Tax=Lutzomyia longipalpis TaxID=7200 RepID=A0A1B0GHU2_LUTLO|nr:cytochrome P450 6j1-like [Lutzomyia longipalpis]
MIGLYLLLTVLAIYLYFKWHLSFFIRRGIAGPSPLPIVGNMWKYVTMQKHFGNVFDEIYQSYPKANYVGFYKLHNPAVLVKDLDVVKDILVGDFSSFHDNDFTLDPKLDPIAVMNPFFATGEKWKGLRSLVTPIFTQSKIRACFPIISGVCKTLVEYLENGPEAGNVNGIEAKTLGEMFTMDVVASAGFSVEGKSFTNLQSPFRKLVADLISPSSSNAIKAFVMLFMPQLAPLFGISFVSKEQDTWIRSFVDQVIRRRKELGEKRQDFLQNFLDIQGRQENLNSKDLVPGQALVFIAEGTETSSTLIGFSLYEIAKHPEVMRRAQEEIDAVYERHGGVLTEEGLMEMEYLEQVLYETLRVHSAVYSMARIATKDYTFPPQFQDSDQRLTIPKGTSIIIPVRSIHYDPTYFPQPYVFDPSRFSEDQKKERHRYAFLAFGEGPRICLGMKFALFQVKAAISSILRNFDISLSPKTENPLKFSKKSFLLVAEGGIWVKFEKRQKK